MNWGEIRRVIEVLQKQPVPTEKRMGYDPVTDCIYHSDGRVEAAMECMQNKGKK